MAPLEGRDLERFAKNKPPRSGGVGAAGVGVPDLGRKELDEAPGGGLAGAGDGGRKGEAVAAGDRPTMGR
jgi:hypothetical protein